MPPRWHVARACERIIVFGLQHEKDKAAGGTSSLVVYLSDQIEFDLAGRRMQETGTSAISILGEVRRSFQAPGT